MEIAEIDTSKEAKPSASYAFVEDSEEIITDFHHSVKSFEVEMHKRGFETHELSFKMESDTEIIVSGKTGTPIFKASSEIVGFVGFAESETSEEKDPENPKDPITYFQWIWNALGGGSNFAVAQEYKKKIESEPSLADYAKHEILYFKDPMMISYLMAIVRHFMEYDLLVSFRAGNEFIYVGFKKIIYL